MSIRILPGELADRIAGIPDASIDCIISDPPYGQTSLQWDRWVPDWPNLLKRVLKPSGSMWVFGTQRMFFNRASEFSGWRLSQDLVWEKHNGTGLFNDRFRRVHEQMLLFYKKESKWRDVYKCPQYTQDAVAKTVRKKGRPAHWIGAYGDSVYESQDGGPRLMRSVIYARSEHGRAVHPTQKPTEIVEPLVLYSCPPNGTVLDPFCGSGTVGVVAKKNSLNAVLIEANSSYVEIAQDRVSSC